MSVKKTYTNVTEGIINFFRLEKIIIVMIIIIMIITIIIIKIFFITLKL